LSPSYLREPRRYVLRRRWAFFLSFELLFQLSLRDSEYASFNARLLPLTITSKLYLTSPQVVEQMQKPELHLVYDKSFAGICTNQPLFTPSLQLISNKINPAVSRHPKFRCKTTSTSSKSEVPASDMHPRDRPYLPYPLLFTPHFQANTRTCISSKVFEWIILSHTCATNISRHTRIPNKAIRLSAVPLAPQPHSGTRLRAASARLT
jgi:hypothetical protein